MVWCDMTVLVRVDWCESLSGASKIEEMLLPTQVAAPAQPPPVDTHPERSSPLAICKWFRSILQRW